MTQCTECRGSGKYVGLVEEEPCRACAGSGELPVTTDCGKWSDGVMHYSGFVSGITTDRPNRNDDVLTGCEEPMGIFTPLVSDKSMEAVPSNRMAVPMCVPYPPVLKINSISHDPVPLTVTQRDQEHIDSMNTGAMSVNEMLRRCGLPQSREALCVAACEKIPDEWLRQIVLCGGLSNMLDHFTSHPDTHSETRRFGGLFTMPISEQDYNRRMKEEGL